jgi:hypothetical protein
MDHTGTMLFSQISLAESRRSDPQSQIESLCAREHAIALEINHLTNTHSLPNWLPDDVLREIFLWCIGDDLEVDIPSRYPQGDDYEPESELSDDADTCTDPECDEDRYMLAWPGWEESDADSESLEDPLPQQIILSHVCSRWRHLALSTSELWSSVFITWFDARSKQLANEWLSKAARYPVSISISSICSCSDWDTASDVEFDIQTELRDFLSAYNIKMLDLPIYSKTWPQLTLILSELPDDNISFLEKLSLTELDEGGSLFLDDARYSRLQFLQLAGRFDGTSFVLPWNSLRELDTTVFYLPFTQCLHILRQCTSLHTCSFGVKFLTAMEYETAYLEYEPVDHPNLSVLLVSFINPAPIHVVLRPLTIPNLTSLIIDRAYFDSDNKLYSTLPLLGSGLSAGYLDLMQRSNYPSIRHLSITYTDFPINIANLLIASPTLTQLTIGHVAFGQTTLGDLAEGQLGPNLQHLAVVRLSDASLREVLDAILLRNSERVGKESVTPFRSVELLDNCLDDTDLMALREVGVELKCLPIPSPW